jgi:serine protease Do
MDKEKQQSQQGELYGKDFDWEAYFTEDDELWEKEKQQRKKRQVFTMKIVGWVLILALLVNGLAIWPRVINLPAIEFLATSSRLSLQDDIKTYKKSVVTIDWDGVKGTGFNIDSEGLIITNEHVVENATYVNVHFKAGHSYVGKVIGKHPELDLAIIDIDADNLPTLDLTFEKDWKIGDSVHFIGNPLAFTQIANEGSIIGEITLKDWDVPVMMIEAPIYKGNSGSPVLNKKGEVIGVVFATLQNPSIETKNIVGVATPSIYIKEIVEKVTE